MPVHSASSKGKLYVGASKVKKAYKGATKFYSSGNIATYKVDTYVSYQEEVDEGESCLLPKSFTPAKAGWEFVGWRQDTSAGGNCLGSLSMGDDPITLYAVFRQTVTVTYYNNSATPSSASEYRYYNNGNIVNPSFTLTQAARDRWTARGWSTSTAGNGGITYNNGVVFMRDSNVTLYGMYQQTITVTYYNNSTSASTTSGTRYYNSGTGNVTDPSFTLAQATLSGWTARGWSTSNSGNAAITYANGATFSRDSNVTLYGLYQQDITVTYYNNSTTASTTTGTRYLAPAGYINPSFILSQASLSVWTERGWSTSTAGNGAISYNNATAFTRDSNVTLYGMYQQTVTVTYYNNSTTAFATSGTRYYNSSGNIVNPSFSLSQAARDGWTARGWSTSIAGNGGITYNNGVVFTRGGDVTLYGMYQQTITVTYYNNSTSASTTSGTRYYNSGTGNVIDPSFTLTQSALSGWTARGWSTSTAGNGGISYNNGVTFARDSNVTLYGMYQQTVTLTYYNGSTNAASTSGMRYYNPGSSGVVNPTFTLTPAALGGWTFRGWALSSAAAAGIAYSSISGTAFSANATVYAAYSQTITLSYNGNGNTGGATASQTGTRYFNSGNYDNPSFTLSANGFSKTDYAFIKWALGSAGGTQYSAGASVTLAESTTFYAIWTSIYVPVPVIVSNADFAESLISVGYGKQISNPIDGRIYKSVTITYSRFEATEYWLWNGWGAGFGTKRSGTDTVLTSAVVGYAYRTREDDDEDYASMISTNGSITLALPNDDNVIIFAGCVGTYGSSSLGLGTMEVTGMTITAVSR